MISVLNYWRIDLFPEQCFMTLHTSANPAAEIKIEVGFAEAGVDGNLFKQRL